MGHPSPNLQKLNRIDPDRLEKEIALMCYMFLKINSTGDNHDIISQQFAGDIILTRPDWKLPEVKVFFDVVRQRQDMECFKIMGNKITSLKLSEMAGCFDAIIRADLRVAKAKIRLKEDDSLIDLKGKFDNIYRHIDSLKTKNATVNHLLRSHEEKEFEERVMKATGYVATVDHFANFDELWKVEERRNGKGERVIEIDGKFMTSADYFAFKEGL